MGLIAVIDTGTGNLRSVSKALQNVAPGQRVEVTSNPDDIYLSERVVMPGQGAIGSWLTALQDYGLVNTLLEVLATKPFLGICLGLEALYDWSDEDGGRECLGRLPGQVHHFTEVPGFPVDQGLKIPHMGWNNVSQTLPHPLWQGIEDSERFYFVHSYCVQAQRNDQVYGESIYGITFAAAAGSNNVFAVQFHPEKSQQPGLQLLRNFVQWDGTV